MDWKLVLLIIVMPILIALVIIGYKEVIFWQKKRFMKFLNNLKRKGK